jgi:hypothetical protein
MSSSLPEEEWSAIRKATYRKADYKYGTYPDAV